MGDAVVGLFMWLFGLCIGSFVNVAVYRLPAGLSLGKPASSFCPSCRKTIRWHDNIPLLSWFLLRARCRDCGARIGVHYPLVEAACGLAFVLVHHLLFVEQTRSGITYPSFPDDLPILLAWLVLAAALIACASMDLAYYFIDTRITDAAMFAAILLYAIWPREFFVLRTAESPLAAAAAAAFLVSGLMLWLTVWRQPDPGGPAGAEHAPDQAETQRPETATFTTPGSAQDAPVSVDAPSPQSTLPALIESADSAASLAAAPRAREHWIGPALGVLALVAITIHLFVLPIHSAAGTPPTLYGACGALLAFFALVVISASHERESDEQIHDAIEAERPRARLVAIRELAWLLPALAAGGLTYAALVRWPELQPAWSTILRWPDGSSLAPLAGAVFAVFGAMVAAAAGWILRIVFTLALGREAFGTGDIYILAAAGAAVGWDLALLGLLLSVGFALAGWIVGLLLKRTSMIPFGPWLALGFVAALWLDRAAAPFFREYIEGVQTTWEHRPEFLVIAAGLVLVGFGGAILLSSLLRGMMESREDTPLECGRQLGYALGAAKERSERAVVSGGKGVPMARKPIAVFDSGLGGLSVVRHLRQLLPNEDIVYFGDTARVPYGTKSRPTVINFALEAARFLLQFDPKLMVAACNTASALAMDELREGLPLPVVGVVDPGAQAAVRLADHGTIAVIGTEATVASEAYPRAIRAVAPTADVITRACPLLVPMVEEGRSADDPLVMAAVEGYLASLRDRGVRVLVLGCTHYPLLRESIATVLGPRVTIIDSGRETSLAIQQALRDSGCLSDRAGIGSIRCYVSDNPGRFRSVGSRFLNEEIEYVEFVEPERYISSGIHEPTAP